MCMGVWYVHVCVHVYGYAYVFVVGPCAYLCELETDLRGFLDLSPP